MTQCARATFFISCFSRSHLHYHHSIVAEMLIPVRFPCFRYFDACFWQPSFQCFLDDVFYSSSSCSFSRSQLHYLQNIHVTFRLLLHRSPDDRISFESRLAAILTKKGCIEPVFGKTAYRLTIMDYHPRDQTEKNYHQLSCRI